MAMDSERLDRTLIDAFNRNAFAGMAAGIDIAEQQGQWGYGLPKIPNAPKV